MYDKLRAVSAESVQQLFSRTLEGAYDDREQWNAVSSLHRLGTRDVLDVAVQWCQSNDPLRRARGADVLAQLGKTAEHLSNFFPKESFAAISRLLETEREILPLSSAIFALGHLDDPSAIPAIYAYHAHPSADVRYAVAFALGCFPNEAKAIEGLIKLTADVDGEVRDWATFGVGVLGDADSVQIRDALVARLSDVNQDAREEALVALAKRCDTRVLPQLFEMLRRSEVSSRVFEAASLMLGMAQDEPEMNRV